MAFGRTFLYHNTCPNGKIFDQEDEYQDCLKSGWVEAPWLIDEEMPIEAPPEPVERSIKMNQGRLSRYFQRSPDAVTKKSQGGK